MKNLKTWASTIVLIVLLIVTLIWVGGVVAALGSVLKLWQVPLWLVPLVSAASLDPPVRLGETGDFLTGWLTPLALTWFVITVFMQKHELGLQRKEFEQLREEFQGNRKAAESQAELQDEANKINNRTLVRLIFEDSKDFTRRNSMHLLNAINNLSQRLGKKPRFSQVTEDNAITTWYVNSLDLLERSALSGGLSLDEIFNDQEKVNDYSLTTQDLIVGLSSQYRSLKSEAERVDMEEYFHAFCNFQIEGEVMKICHQICESKGL